VEKARVVEGGGGLGPGGGKIVYRLDVPTPILPTQQVGRTTTGGEELKGKNHDAQKRTF